MAKHSHSASLSKAKDAILSAANFLNRIPRRVLSFVPAIRSQKSTIPSPSSATPHSATTNPEPSSRLQTSREMEKPASVHCSREVCKPELPSCLKPPQTLKPPGLKENGSVTGELAKTFSRLSVAENGAGRNLVIRPPEKSPEETRIHQGFMNEALEMARLALRTNETPVGCVLVHKGRVIAKGMNATNVTRNGTRHAEFMAISALLSVGPGTEHEGAKNADSPARNGRPGCYEPRPTSNESEMSDESLDEERSARGHLHPYGQKFHPAPVVDRSIVRDCVLYVTVEPCVMCASLLRQLGIRKVYFGALNDKFGGAGGVFNIHENTNLSAPNQVVGGDGGRIEPGFEVEGGWGRDEAVGLLRRFYVQENGRAPIPRKKEGRAARLAALEQESRGGPVESSERLGADENDTTELAGSDDRENKLVDPTPGPVSCCVTKEQGSTKD